MILEEKVPDARCFGNVWTPELKPAWIDFQLPILE